MISSFHAHVYFRNTAERDQAETLRHELSRKFPVTLGRWHDIPIGPHDLPMYQVSFAPETFADLAPWLMLNRRGLAILLHPNTGRPRDDHLIHAVWFGEMLPIRNAEQLAEVE